MTRTGWNRRIAVNQRDHALHFALEPRHPLRIVVLLCLLAWRGLGPNAMNQPDWMGGVRQIPIPQRRVEVWRMNGVNPHRVGAHLGNERDPSLVGAVIGREL